MEDKLQLIKNKQAELEAAVKLIQAKAEAEGRTLLTEEEEHQLNEIFSEYANTLKVEKAIWDGEDKDL